MNLKNQTSPLVPFATFRQGDVAGRDLLSAAVLWPNCTLAKLVIRDTTEMR